MTFVIKWNHNNSITVTHLFSRGFGSNAETSKFSYLFQGLISSLNWSASYGNISSISATINLMKGMLVISYMNWDNFCCAIFCGAIAFNWWINIELMSMLLVKLVCSHSVNIDFCTEGLGSFCWFYLKYSYCHVLSHRYCSDLMMIDNSTTLNTCNCLYKLK